MITVHTWDAEDGVWIQVDGHASEGWNYPITGPETLEGIRVCAGVSALVVVLANLCDDMETLAAGGDDMDGTGFTKCRVPQAKLAHADFVIAGLYIIATSYCGLIGFDRRDSKLFQQKETREWNTLVPKS